MNDKSNAAWSESPPTKVSMAGKRVISLAMVALASLSQGCAGTQEAANQDLLARLIAVIETCHQLKSQSCVEGQLGAKFHPSSQYDFNDGRVAHSFRFEQEPGTPTQDWWQWSFLEKDSVLVQSSLSIPINSKNQCIVESELVRRMGTPTRRTPILARGTPMGISLVYSSKARDVDFIGSFPDLPCLGYVTVKFPAERIQ